MTEKTAKNEQGQKEARELFAKFVKRFGDDPAFCIEQFSAGVDIDEATVAYTEKLKAENARLVVEEEFIRNPKLRDEFSNDIEAYMVFKKADAEGRVHLPAPKTTP